MTLVPPFTYMQLHACTISSKKGGVLKASETESQRRKSGWYTTQHCNTQGATLSPKALNSPPLMAAQPQGSLTTPQAPLHRMPNGVFFSFLCFLVSPCNPVLSTENYDTNHTTSAFQLMLHSSVSWPHHYALLCSVEVVQFLSKAC